MRRKDKEITEKVILEEILREQEIGRLGTCIGAEPYVVPLNFAYRDEKIYIHSYKEGKKIRSVSLNPFVCFEVDVGVIIEANNPCRFGFKYRSVIAYGPARILEKPEEILRGLKIITQKYSPGKGRMLNLETLDKFPNLRVIEITVDRMTGKKSPPSYMS